MPIIPVTLLNAQTQTLMNVGQGSLSGSAASSTGGVSFSHLFSQGLQGVAASLSQADSAASSYATGGNVSIEQVMLAEQKATLSVDAMTAVQKNVVQSYQAVMNMQV